MTRPPVIAVVDDDLAVRKAIGRLLRSAGFAAVTFESASRFLDDTSQTDPACLILDVRMPRMDGLELQARLAALNSRVPIIFITAIDDAVAEAKARAAGALAFLPKPFDDAVLLDAVNRALAVSSS
jgi:FixJ family two-component response regulator